MIVPCYWAEGRLQHKSPERQITLRRFGWSDVSEADAQAHADARVKEAMDAALQGRTVPRRDPKVPYNGADGVPIREEIVARHGDAVITRNSYGARCLNTPNVLFADIDFDPASGFRFTFVVMAVALLGAIALAISSSNKGLGVALALAAIVTSYTIARILKRSALKARGGMEAVTRSRIDRFASAHPDWSMRVYRTPNGFRVLVTHAPFQADDAAVESCFQQLNVDPVYARMCRHQKCFRARVSAKPWRIGISQHMKPRPGTWPIAPEHQAARQSWINAYEHRAASFAACSFVASLGIAAVHPEIEAVLRLHDELCAVHSLQPIA